jgi:hypothetical protein
MSTFEIVAFAVIESIGVFLAIRIWCKNSNMSVPVRLFWSAVLLVPLLGCVFYAFMVNDPEAHSDLLPEHWDGRVGSPPSDHH